MATDVFSIYTPDVPNNSPTPCMRDPVRLFDVVFILSILFWFPGKWWRRGSHTHDAWVASVVAILVVHIIWLMTANAAGQPSEDTWEYATAIGVFFLAIAAKSLVASTIPYLVPVIVGFYGLQFIYSFEIHDTQIMTVLLVLLLVVSFATCPLTVYLLKSTASDWIKDLLDLAFRTVLMVTAFKFLILQSAESNGVICCTISRDWQLTTNCPLSVSITLLFVCIGVLVLRVGIELYIWKQKRRATKEETQALTKDKQEKEKEEEEEGDSSAE